MPWPSRHLLVFLWKSLTSPKSRSLSILSMRAWRLHSSGLGQLLMRSVPRSVSSHVRSNHWYRKFRGSLIAGTLRPIRVPSRRLVHLPKCKHTQVFSVDSYDRHGSNDILSRHGRPADIFPVVFCSHGGIVAPSRFTFHLVIIDPNTPGCLSTILTRVSMISI